MAAGPQTLDEIYRYIITTNLGAPNPADITLGVLLLAMGQAIQNAEGAGVASFNTRTGAVTLQVGDVEATFTAAGQLLVGTGSGTGTLLAGGTNGQGLVGNTGAAPSWQAIVNTFNTRAGAITLTAADVEAVFTAAGQVLFGTGSSTGSLTDILAALETKFSAANQVILGTGSGTGALTDILTAISNKFTAAGQILTGTGSGTGSLLAVGAAGTHLVSTGAAAPSWTINPLPVAATVATSQTTASTSFTDLATVGPAVTVTTGTSAIVMLTSDISTNAINGSGGMGVAVSGASTIAAAIAQSLLIVSATSGQQIQSTAVYPITGLTAGSNTFTAKYLTGGATTSTFVDRAIVVIPLP